MNKNLMYSVEETFNSGYAWYIKQLKEDGSFPGITRDDSAAFYNVLYLFFLGGKWKEAERFVSWARANLIDENNAFYIDPDGIYANRGIYFRGWNVLGAHSCGFFDLSLSVIDGLLSYQDEVSGGFYCSEKRAHTDQGYTDLNAAALVGYAALVTGRHEQARKAARYIAHIMDIQPDFPHKIYAYYNPRKKSLVTELPAGLSAKLVQMDNIYAEKKTVTETDIDIWHLCLDTNSKDKVRAYAGLSMAFVFVCEMYRVTGEPVFKTAAMKMFDFFNYAGDKCWIEGQTTKVLWGLALLSTISDDKRVDRAIVRLSSHLCKIQIKDKGWVSPVIGSTFEEQPYWVSLALAGDILMGLAAVLRYCKGGL